MLSPDMCEPWESNPTANRGSLTAEGSPDRRSRTIEFHIGRIKSIKSHPHKSSHSFTTLDHPSFAAQLTTIEKLSPRSKTLTDAGWTEGTLTDFTRP